MSDNDKIKISGNVGTGVVYGDVHGSVGAAHGQMNTESTVNGHQVSIEALSIQLGALENAIECSSATEEQKNDALGLMRRFLKHPVVAAVLGGAAGSSLPLG